MDRVAHLLTTTKDEIYNYSYILPFEDGFTAVRSTVWMQDNWYHSLTLSVLYAASLYIGQRVMSKRPAFNVDNILTFWNGGLAIFSIMGALRMSPEFFYVLSRHGFQYSMCTAGYAQTFVTGFWTEMFAYSKAFELIDTMFIILRKRPLIFLHWYHHITVLIYTWHAYKDHTAAGRWFVWMNYHVHAFMYSYYTLRSCGWRFPKWIPMSITCMQLSQMVVGCLIAIQTYRLKSQGEFCQQTNENLYFSFGIYFTYFLLFAHFFYEAYLKNGNRYAQSQRKFREKGVEHHHKNGTTIENGKYENGKIANGTTHENGKIANGTTHENGKIEKNGTHANGTGTYENGKIEMNGDAIIKNGKKVQ